MLIAGEKLFGLPALCAVFGILFAPLAHAQQAPGDIGITEPSIATSLPQNGDPFGARKRLYDHGISYNVIYTNDVLSNLSGGIRRGTIDQGKIEAQLLIDLEKLAGLKDWTFYANAFGIYNTGRIRRDYVGGMNTIAAIEATPTIRLSEVWLERWLGPMSFRFGQLAADAEFFYSDLSQIFMQSDWPTIAASTCRAAVQPIRCPRSVRVSNTNFRKMRLCYLLFSTAILPGRVLANPTRVIGTA